MEKIGSVPEFTDADTQATEESSEQEEEVTSGEDTPSEAATEDEPSGEKEESTDDVGAETKELQKEIAGLSQAREELIRDLKELRGERRELKQREIDRVDKQIEEKVDDLVDVHPDDTKLIERVLRAKGYVSQSEVNRILFDHKKQEVISNFLHEFPEYRPENDPDNKKWGTILEEISLYREPASPEQYAVLLRRAHRLASVGSTTGPSVAVKKHQAQIASAGSGGTRKPSSPNRLASLVETHMHGYTQEEIAEMQKRLSNR